MYICICIYLLVNIRIYKKNANNLYCYIQRIYKWICNLEHTNGLFDRCEFIVNI